MFFIQYNRYIGNLDPSVSEDLLMALFAQIGPCKNCKIIHEVRILLYDNPLKQSNYFFSRPVIHMPLLNLLNIKQQHMLYLL
jgi:hypothetical protein